MDKLLSLTASDRSGDLRSETTRYYSKKPSSKVTTHCDEDGLRPFMKSV